METYNIDRVLVLDTNKEGVSNDFKVIEVNVSDETENLPALVNPIKLNL
ncbi:hypothetical protein [Sutcliffiella rhizosphaerae]|nr:hypothetical protein [Sutcliffiella rhizosphaerae]